jgi:beta-phosphoglucomutase family hydrolase
MGNLADHLTGSKATDDGGTVIPKEIQACIFDLDGVITDTASIHAAAWKRMFDDFLRSRPDTSGADLRPFEPADYRRYVDGKPRYDGVQSFLESRAVSLPYGSPDDPPELETICGLGNRKNEEFQRHLDENGVQVFPDTIAFIDGLHQRGIRTAVISASRNCQPVLRAAGVEDLFETRVDGVIAAELGLPGKPDPAVFLEATRRLEATPDSAAIVEDALAGVEAGRRGGFALVIGVDRTGHPDDLLEHGADVVSSDLAQLLED